MCGQSMLWQWFGLVHTSTHSCAETTDFDWCFCDCSISVSLEGLVTMGVSGTSSGTFINLLQNSQKALPCFGFVRMSAHILSVGQYLSIISFWSTLSLIKKYQTFMCLVRFDAECMPLDSGSKALLLSWWRTLGPWWYPWHSRKYFVQRMCGRASSTPIISLSVELFPLIFCLRDMVIAIPFPIDMLAPVWLLQSLCAACYVSTHHLTTGVSSAVSLRSNVIVPFRYLSTRLSFPQSSSSRFLTLVVRTSTGVCISLLAREDKKSNWATIWWNITACSSGRMVDLLSLLWRGGLQQALLHWPWLVQVIHQWLFSCILSWTLLILQESNNLDPYLNNHAFFLDVWSDLCIWC